MFILILMMHAGILSVSDANSLTTAEFSSRANCEAAGKAASGLAKNTVKFIEYVCAPK